MKNQQRILSLVLVVVLCLQPLAVQAKQGGLQGFKEVRKEKYGEDVLHTYSHAKSGLEVIWIENKDKNKAFTLGVKTPTNDDTGVNHIIEHTLFTGSEDYPSASLFFDANEAYPCTFMNAMTSGDMTIFPFATPYDACYKALLSIYLDAVFRPQLLKSPYGFYEEGFHKVPEENRTGGVVYNEMKGAYNNIDRTVYRQLRKMIYKDTHYSFDSGGNPNAIPTLTYEQCLKTYKSFYYPGNMRIILYGSIPIKETLKTIEGYVADCDQAIPSVDLSVAAINKEHTSQVKALAGTDKGCLVKAFVLDDSTSSERLQDLELWMTAYLMGSHSYLQTSLNALGLHTKWLKDDDVPYPIYALVASDIPCEKMQDYSILIDSLMQEVLKKINKNVFLERDMLQQTKWLLGKQEESNRRGVNIAQSMLDSWAHDREMDQYFISNEKMKKITEVDMTSGSLLLNNAQRYTLFLLPQEERTLIPPEQLTKVPDEKWNEIYHQMKKWQSVKTALKPLELKQLLLDVEKLPTIQRTDDYWTMVTRTETPLVRSQLYLNTSHIAKEDLNNLFLYSYLLEESAGDISPFYGTLSTSCTAYPLKNGYWPCFRLAVTTLPEETEHGVLFNEARAGLLHRSDSWYRHKVTELTAAMKAGIRNNAIGTLAGLSVAGEDERSDYLYSENYPFYCFCQELVKRPDKQWIQQVKEIDQKLYRKGGIILSTILPEKAKNKYQESWEKVITGFEKVPNLKGSYDLEVPEGNCLIQAETAVDYGFKSLYKKDGITGEDYLLAAYLTKNYLNPQLRVKLGAYGAGCQIYDPKTLGIYTYRAPDIRKALVVMDGCSEYLSRPISEEVLERSKAEAISRIHNQYKMLGTPLERAAAMEQLILWGRSPHEVILLQKEVLVATPRTIRQKHKLYEKLINEGKTAVMTGKDCTQPQNFTVYRY